MPRALITLLLGAVDRFHHLHLAPRPSILIPHSDIPSPFPPPPRRHAHEPSAFHKPQSRPCHCVLQEYHQGPNRNYPLITSQHRVKIAINLRRSAATERMHLWVLWLGCMATIGAHFTSQFSSGCSPSTSGLPLGISIDAANATLLIVTHTTRSAQKAAHAKLCVPPRITTPLVPPSVHQTPLL
ncbi:hypothetical protein BDW22DRAFT_851855 [Trametopsis cervina]|nr:hypothetical protein BDW22DRAFT_851855 [Trametopsis cervina]